MTTGFPGTCFLCSGVLNLPHGACPALLASTGDAGVEVLMHVQSGLLPQALRGPEENGTHPLLAQVPQRSSPGLGGGEGTTPMQQASQGGRAAPKPLTGMVPPPPRPHPAAARSPTWPWSLPGAAAPECGPSAPAPVCSSFLPPCGTP